jgi:hypothetical protein
MPRSKTAKPAHRLSGGGPRKSDRAGEPIFRTDGTSRAFLQGRNILTAVPAGEQWRVKAIDSHGGVALLGIFPGRLEALGAAVLVAHNCGARVVP